MLLPGAKRLVLFHLVSQGECFIAMPDGQWNRLEGGDIVVGPVTAARIKTRFVLEALGEKSFKNVSQPLAVYRVIPPGIYSGVRV